MWNVQKVVNDGEEETDKLLSVLTDHRTPGESKRQKKHEIQISYRKPNSLAQLLVTWYSRGKSSEGLKTGLKVWPSIQGFNIELVIFKEDFGRSYKSSCSRRVFDLTPSWFLLLEVWSMCLTPLTGMLLSHRVYSEQPGLSLRHPESSEVGKCIGLMLHWAPRHFLGPLQTS